MTYFAGVGPRLAQVVGGVQIPSEPHAKCDGCGAIALGVTGKGRVAAWFRKGDAPKGWFCLRAARELEIPRRDYCKRCRVAVVKP